MLCSAVRREAGTIEVELEQLKGSVMALTVAANSSAEGETYRELADALLRVRVFGCACFNYIHVRALLECKACCMGVQVLPWANSLNTTSRRGLIF
jgi:hypothetical protein